MQNNILNPVIVHKTMTFEQLEMKENKRENVEFKLLLMQNLQNAKKHILHYKNSISYPKNRK